MVTALKTLSSTLLLLPSSIRAMSSVASSSHKPSAIIFLHGLGDTEHGWSSTLQSTLPNHRPSLSPNNENLTYVFPPAPTIPISINGGMTMPGWFDLYDWPIGVGVRDDIEGLEKAVDVIEASVQKLKDEKGIERDRIVVGGFSQGGAVALLSAYQKRNDGSSFAGCVSLSGWLTCKDKLAENKVSTPLFWGHGTYDDKVLFEQQDFGTRTLVDELGILDSKNDQVISKSYDVGHSSTQKELEDLADFLDKLLFPTEG